MTLDLRAIRELREKATPGKWQANHGSWNSNVTTGPLGGDIRDIIETKLVVESAKRADADFIAASRTAIPELLALVEELQRARDEACEALRLVASRDLRPADIDLDGVERLAAIGQRAEGVEK